MSTDNTRTKRLQILGDLTPLPKVTEADNDKVLTAKDGKWVASELPKYDGEYEVTPLTEGSTTLKTANTFMSKNVHVKEIPYYEVTNSQKGTTVSIGTEV